MAATSEQDRLEHSMAAHIFGTSSTMVGICLASLGLLRINDRLKNVNTVADELLALEALIFLVSCVFSYFCLRGNPKPRTRMVEKAAESLFLIALSLMVVIAGLIAYEFL